MKATALVFGEVKLDAGAILYDALNRLVETIYPDGATNATVYDDVGRVARSIDARGTITANGYDVAGRRIAVTNAFGISGIVNTNFYSYDANGNQITFTDADGHTTTNVFDPLNRQVQVQYPDGTATETVYDRDGRTVAQTNQDRLATLFGYDGAGRLVAVTNALDQVTRYQYDEAGNEILQVDALNRTNIFAYDSMNRKIAHTMPGGQSEGFAYDLDGNQIYETNFNRAVITNQYDVDNRLIARIYPDGTSNAFTYTLTGQRATMSDASGSYAYAYDLRDRLLTNAGPAGTLSYGYDANGNMTNIMSSTVDGTLVTYQYDPLNRLTNVDDGRLGGAQNTAYHFDAAGNLQGMAYPNGVTNLYQYDSLNRLTNLVWKTGSTSLGTFAYALGATGNRTNLGETINGTSRTYTWQYDHLYRLTNEVVSSTPSGSLFYQYDGVGNRLSRTAGLGLSSQALGYSTNDWLTNDTYDGNGNTINSASKPYQYDYENRLTNFNNGQVILVYDGDGNRVKKVTSAGTTLYLVDTMNPSGYPQVLEELTVSGGVTNLSRAYTWGLGLISQRIPGTGTNFYGFDGHGSVRFLTGTSGSITNSYTYDAFGNVINSSGTAPNSYLYCSQQYDSDLGLYYNRARYLNTGTGRFWTMDTDEGDNQDPLSLHKYLYGADDPVNLIDPSGNDGIDDFFDFTDYLPGFGVAFQKIRGQLAYNDMLNANGYETLAEFQETHPGYLGLMTVGDSSAVQAAAATAAASGKLYVLIATSVTPTGSGGQFIVELTQERLEHIAIRHFFSSTAQDAGKFASSIGETELRGLIAQAVTKGTVRANTGGRAGQIFEFDTGTTIGENSSGAATSRIRVVVDPKGKVITAFPY